MTRINCIPPAELTGPHLIAEYRELPRVFGLVRQAIARGERPDDPRNPATYRLGPGHIRFFYPRLKFLFLRQSLIIAEMRARGYAPGFTDPSLLLEGIPAEWQKDWIPCAQAMALNRQRIAQRLQGAAHKARDRT